MPDIKIGDRVRVTFDGVVTYENHPYEDVPLAYDIKIDGANKDVEYVPAAHIAVVSPPVKVGDPVTADNIGDIPPGSVVVGAGGHSSGLAAQKNTDNEWRTADAAHISITDEFIVRHWGAVVVHIPGGAA